MLSDSDTEDIQTLTINEHYAKAFEYKKEREELAKLKEKYGSDFEEDADEETDSEDAESEDEDGEELTPAVDAAILRTLARIKKKDPAIYNTENIIFEEEQERTAIRAPLVQERKTKDKSKPLTFRQAALASALEANTSRSPSPEPHIPTHTEEQLQLRDETRAAFHTAVDESDDDGLLVPREKTKDELEHEEEEYREYLRHAVGQDLEGLIEVENSGIGAEAEKSEEGPSEKRKSKTKKKDKEVKGMSKQEADQEFLMNYILNRGWIDKSAKRVPTYKEVVKPKLTKSKAKDLVIESEASDEEQGNVADGNQHAYEYTIEDDDEFEEIADAFETSYNFRFEEPDAATIKSFPRNIVSTVRRVDTTRKEGRERKKQRQEEELEKKHEEVKRLKALKMKEVRRKLERIGREGGVSIDPDAEVFKEFDLDADWDPEAHDMQMAGLYHDGNDSDVDIDQEKPVWDDDVDIDDIIPPSQPPESSSSSNKKKKKKKKKNKDEDKEAGVDIDAMDADVVREYDDKEDWDGTEEMRKRKLDEYMDEVYGLEFNDMVAGMPTRFKYTTTAPQTFALTPAEILMATDKELNQYVSVKRYAPYRAEKWDHNRGERLLEFREKLKERGGTRTSHRSEDLMPKKRLGKKERQKMKAAAGGEDERRVGVGEVGEAAAQKQKIVLEEQEEVVEQSAENEPSKKKRRRKHKTVVQAESMHTM